MPFDGPSYPCGATYCTNTSPYYYRSILSTPPSNPPNSTTTAKPTIEPNRFIVVEKSQLLSLKVWWQMQAETILVALQAVGPHTSTTPLQLIEKTEFTWRTSTTTTAGSRLGSATRTSPLYPEVLLMAVVLQREGLTLASVVTHITELQLVSR